MEEIDVYEEIQRVVRGEVAMINLTGLAKKSGYTRWRLIELAREAGLTVVTAARRDIFNAYKSKTE